MRRTTRKIRRKSRHSWSGGMTRANRIKLLQQKPQLPKKYINRYINKMVDKLKNMTPNQQRNKLSNISDHLKENYNRVSGVSSEYPDRYGNYWQKANKARSEILKRLHPNSNMEHFKSLSDDMKNWHTNPNNNNNNKA
jgi:hypothetical protein